MTLNQRQLDHARLLARRCRMQEAQSLQLLQPASCKSLCGSQTTMQWQHLRSDGALPSFASGAGVLDSPGLHSACRSFNLATSARRPSSAARDERWMQHLLCQVTAFFTTTSNNAILTFMHDATNAVERWTSGALAFQCAKATDDSKAKTETSGATVTSWANTSATTRTTCWERHAENDMLRTTRFRKLNF